VWGPGPIIDIRSPTHIFITRRSSRTEISTPTHNSVVSKNPHITVEWQPFNEEYDDGYYYEFNQISDHKITKRNAPDILPLKMRKVTSAELSGNNVSYYFHVAAVDNRGKIGPTSTREFRIDTVPPANGSVIAPEVTSNTVIALVLGATGVKEMYISNTGYGQGGEWETRVKEKQWQMTEGDGPKKVYIQFRDEAGNVANYLVETEKVSEPEFAMADATFSVDENSPDGTVVGTVTATNPDGPLNYMITEGNTDDIFLIDSGSGAITVNDGSQLDYETTESYTFTVEASDGMNTVTAEVTVNIADVDEMIPNMPPVVEDEQRFSVNENSVKGTSVGVITASDPDSDTLTYSITEGNLNDAFAIGKESGEITVNDSAPLDYETTTSYTLTVRVSDNTDTVTVTITVNIDDVNEEIPNDPPVAEDQSFSVNEKSIKGAFVGTIIASDPDSDALKYGITEGNINETFAIDSDTGEITVNDGSQLAYETADAYTLAIQISDGVNAITITVTVNINNVDIPNEPPVAEDQTFSVNENSPAGTFVGAVTAMDSDGESLIYTITEGNTENIFAIGSETGEITVSDSSQLDYETTDTHTLTIRISDAVETVTIIVTVNITDVDEARPNEPPAVENQTFSVNENSPAGTSVGVVTATDSDGDPLIYTISAGNADDVFAIHSETGAITVNDGSRLDYETTASYTLTVQVWDGRETDSAAITITVSDVDEDIPNTPPVIGDQVFSVNENSPWGTLVGSIAANDADSDRLTYSITEGNTDNAFAIDTETGDITVNDSRPLDYETETVHVFIVQVWDGRADDTAMVTININDVNEDAPNTPPTMTDQSFSVDENSANGTVVGSVTASDSDPEDILTWRITAGNTNSAFAINKANGEISVADGNELDHETTAVYTLTIEVSDGRETATARVTVNVSDVDETKLVGERSDILC
jgi:hypothetical protein